MVQSLLKIIMKKIGCVLMVLFFSISLYATNNTEGNFVTDMKDKNNEPPKKSKAVKSHKGLSKLNRNRFSIDFKKSYYVFQIPIHSKIGSCI